MSTRYTFANQLRGVASLCVVANHLTGVYWAAPQLVADATFSAVPATPAPAFAAFSANAWYNLGPFGVALFFLISGFVIPISLDRQTPAGFAVGRIFRIYPTYLAAFAIELAVIALSAHHWQRPFTYPPKTIAVNALLISDIISAPSIDLVNWTLMVELKFYVLTALLAAPIRRGNLLTIFAVAATILFVSAFSHQIFLIVPAFGRLLRIFESNALYVLYMLIGVAFSFHVRGRIGTTALIASVGALFALFVLCWPLTFFRGEYPSATYNYAWALLVFGGMYALRSRVPDSRIADFFAAISYPLYLVHALVGYTVITLLLAAGANAAVATAAAFAIAVALALGLHVTVEGRSQTLGKQLAARWFGRPPAENAYLRSAS